MSEDIFKGKGLDKFKNLGFNFNRDSLPKVDFVSPQQDILRKIKENEQININLVNASQKKKAEYEQEVLQTLKNIESNTTGLTDIVPLLSKNLENQEDLLNFLKESLAISASKTKEEAEGKFRSLMIKATQLTGDIETIQKLMGFANTIFTLFQKNHG